MTMIHGEAKGKKPTFFVDDRVHPQTLAVVQTRAAGLGVDIVTGDYQTFEFTKEVSGALVQYPATDGAVLDYAGFAAKVKAAGGKVACACDLLALTHLEPPGSWGADIAVGTSQ